MSRMILKTKKLSRRTISIVSAVSICLTMILGVVSGVVLASLNTNPVKADDLNHSTVVQTINVLPVEPDAEKGSRTFFDYHDNSTSDGSAKNIQTTQKKSGYMVPSGKYSEDLMDVIVNEDGSVRLKAAKTVPFSQSGAATGNTLYSRVYTYINQRINPMENPWFMLSFTGTARLNGHICFTITIDGEEYRPRNASANFTGAEKELKESYQFPIANLVLGRGPSASSVDTTHNDTDANVTHDYVVDFYDYIYKHCAYFQDNTVDPAKWKEADCYITIKGVAINMVTEKNTDYKEGTYLELEKMAFGRDVLTQPVSLLPRYQQSVEIEDDDVNGRVSKLNDNAISFYNASTTKVLRFTWKPRAYFNVAEFDCLHVNATFTGMTQDKTNVYLYFGGNVRDDVKSYQYIPVNDKNQDGVKDDNDYTRLCDLIDYFGAGVDIRDNATGTYQATVNFKDFVDSKKDQQNFQIPDDKLIFVDEIFIELHPGAKMTFSQLEMKMSDDSMAATKADSVYPWAAGSEPETIAPVGTPATSALLKDTAGVSYDWAVSVDNAPTVRNKVDLLALRNTGFMASSTEGSINNGEGSDVIPSDRYQILPTGESVFTSSGYKDYGYHALMRQERWVPGKDTSDNFFLYLDVTKGSSTTSSHTTPYLYYSYTVEDLDKNDNIAPAAGLVFCMTETKSGGYRYYLDQTGIALIPCDDIFGNTDITPYEVVMSTGTERNGCIDLSGMANENQLLAFEQARIYLTPNTKLTMHYFFVGGASLSDKATDIVATQGGLAFPWTLTKDEFNAACNPSSTASQFTYANKIDLLKQLNDRSILHDGNTFPNATVNDDGTFTISAARGQKTSSYLGFDYTIKGPSVNNNELDELRYLNYSVSAPTGVRWSMVFSDRDGSRAVLSWADHKSTFQFSFYESGSKVPAGLSYFRFFETYDAYNSWASDNNKAWRNFAVSGSQSGCIDFQQSSSFFDWGDILTAAFVVYCDPSANIESGSITIDYLYLTSEPVDKANVGQAALDPGKAYNWETLAVPSPYALLNSPADAKASASVSSSYKGSDNQYELVDYTFQLPEALSSRPWFFYSYRLKNANGDLGRVGMAIVRKQSSTEYLLFRNAHGSTSTYSVQNGIGKASFINMKFPYDATSEYTLCYKTLSNNDVIPHPAIYSYGAETGCADAAQLFSAGVLGTSNFTTLTVRFYIDRTLYPSSEYSLEVDYLYFANGANGNKPSFTQKTVYNFSNVESPEHYKVPLHGSNVSFPVTVDLEKTPYLYYSLRYNNGESGTFVIKTGEGQGFYRDPSRTDHEILTPGVTTTTNNYLLTSETGCVNLWEWYRRHAEDRDSITIQGVEFKGNIPTVEYMFFAPRADIEVDLIPSQPGGGLKNGVPTNAWGYYWDSADQKGYGASIAPTNTQWDRYIPESQTGEKLPSSTLVKFEEDSQGDLFNNLRYMNEAYWSQIHICYGDIVVPANGNSQYITSGGNQTAGLTINLNETPYLHFSFTQPETSKTMFQLQINDYTSETEVYNKPANAVRPHNSFYVGNSPAGQLVEYHAESKDLVYYKDTDNYGYESGSFAGVIDLRTWYAETNGCDPIINLERVVMYTSGQSKTDVTVNRFYLSSSAAAAYNVTFNKNDKESGSQTYTQSILINANEQYVSDEAVSDFKKRDENGDGITDYYFIGWYTDKECTQYFDIYNTPISTDITLYAGWIDKTIVVDSNEVHFLDQYNVGSPILAPGAESPDSHAVTAENGIQIGTADTPTAIQFGVNKAYDIEALKSIYIGFDTDRTVHLSDNTFKVEISYRTTGMYTTELLSCVFDLDTHSETKTLVAGPYDVEVPLYLYLATYNRLPAMESETKLIMIESLSVSLPTDMRCHLRYVKAGVESPDGSDLELIAPYIENPHDLLESTKNDGDAFVIGDNHILYEKNPDTQSYITEISDKQYVDSSYKAVSIGSMKEGYVHLGNLYEYTLDRTSTSTDNNYLHYSIQQPKGSSVGMAIYAAFDGHYQSYKQGSDTEMETFYVFNQFTTNSVLYLTGDNTLSQTMSYIEQETIQGSLNLKELYETALHPYRSTAVTTNVRILGIRFFTSDSTDADVNYLILGGRDLTNAVDGNGVHYLETYYMHINYKPKRGALHESGSYYTFTWDGQYSYKNGENYYHLGDTVTVSLDDLQNLTKTHDGSYNNTGEKVTVPELNDPSKVFVGWFFRDFMIVNPNNTSAEYYEYGADGVVYWNPYAKNGRKYNAVSNPEGAWSEAPIEGFVTNLREVTYTFDLRDGNTQIIAPIWQSKDYEPLLSTSVNGNGGTVSLIHPAETALTDGKANVRFGEQVVVRAKAAEGYVFKGWYDVRTNTLVSSAQDYTVTMYADVSLEARFEAATNVQRPDVTILDNGFKPSSSGATVWLQSNNSENFTLKAANNNGILYAADGITEVEPTYSSYWGPGGKGIQTYWNLQKGQVVTVVANDPTCHWIQRMADGSWRRVSQGQELTFIVAESIRLFCVNEEADSTDVVDNIVNDYAAHITANDKASDQKRITAQFLPDQFLSNGEEIVACGVVVMDAACNADLPYFESGDAAVYYADAWNSTTGQYTIEFPIDEEAGIYKARAFAIVKLSNGRYTVRYGDCLTTIV